MAVGDNRCIDVESRGGGTKANHEILNEVGLKGQTFVLELNNFVSTILLTSKNACFFIRFPYLKIFVFRRKCQM